MGIEETGEKRRGENRREDERRGEKRREEKKRGRERIHLFFDIAPNLLACRTFLQSNHDK